MPWSAVSQHGEGAIIITPEVLHSRCIDFAKLTNPRVFHVLVHLSGIIKENRTPEVFDQWHLIAGSDKLEVGLANNIQKARLSCFLPSGVQPVLCSYVGNHNNAIPGTLQRAKQSEIFNWHVPPPHSCADLKGVVEVES